MEISNKTVWVIMSKDRKFIAKGTPRSRYLVEVSDIKCNKRFLTYSSKGMAESGFNNSFFYGSRGMTADDLEAVEVEMILKIKNGK